MTFQQNREHDKIRTGGVIISIPSVDGWLDGFIVGSLVLWLIGCLDD